jgi:Transposase IS116/IS110/IS902 family/Transposase
VALAEAGCDLSLLGARHAARLRGAISGKHKSDVIDADVLARAGEVFDLHPLRPLEPARLALRSACVRRGGSVIDGNRHLRRLISLARWAFPDVWNGFRGPLPTAVAVLDRWPHLAQLAAARRTTLTAVVALHTRGVADVPDRVEAIRSAAAAWTAFWDGHLDLDALAFDVTEHLTDMADAKARTERATGQAQRYWRQLYGDDELLLSVPGMGPVTASVIRGFLADGTAFGSGKAAASYIGLNPSTWSSGTVSQPSRAITKEGPRSAPVGVLPSRQRGPAAGSAAGRVLPPADDPARALPHPGLRGGRPQAGGADLDSAQPRHPLPDPGSRRPTNQPA